MTKSWGWLVVAIPLIGWSQPAPSDKPATLIQPQVTKDSLATGTVLTPTTPARAKSRSDSLHIVQHGFNHKQQIITGSVVMSCLALIMVTMNNYNPR
jgi:hypothetical protein